MGKRSLDIGDIQDDADIYDRLVIRQKQKAKRPKKQEDPYDDTERVQLHERLERVQNKKREEKKRTKAVPMDNADDRPALVESVELAEERLVYSIHDVKSRCREMLDKYEDLELHLLFADKLVNDEFRRYLGLVASHLHEDSGLSKIREALFVKVIKDSIAKQDAKKSMKERFVERYSSRKEATEEERDPRSIRRTARKLKVPPTLKQLLEGEPN